MYWKDESRLNYRLSETHQLFVRKYGLDETNLTELKHNDYSGLGIKPGDTVLDCGAYLGQFAKYAFDQGAGHVISIEADPNNYFLMRTSASTLDSFKIRQQELTMYGYVLWGHWETEFMRALFSIHPTDSSLSTAYPIISQERFFIDKISLMDLIEDLHPTVVKIDVVGSELSVFFLPVDFLSLKQIDSLLIYYYIRNETDRKRAKLIHEGINMTMGLCIEKPILDSVRVPKRESFMFKTYGLYKRDPTVDIERYNIQFISNGLSTIYTTGKPYIPINI